MRREEAIDGNEAVEKIGRRADLGRLEEERPRDGPALLGATAASMDWDRSGNPSGVRPRESEMLCILPGPHGRGG